MRVGLCYDVRTDDLIESAEFDRPETIELVRNGLAQLGHDVTLIGNGRDLARYLVGGERPDLVFNMAEGREGRSREAQVPALLDMFNIAYTFSDACTMAIALDKGTAKRIWASHSLPVTPFAEILSVSDIEAYLGSRSFVGFPVFVKPAWEGTSKGIDRNSVVHDLESLSLHAMRIVRRFRQPVLIEPFLEGPEFTVGIVGTGKSAEVIGTTRVDILDGSNPPVYGFNQKEECEIRVNYVPVSCQDDPSVQRIEEIARESYVAVGCRDAGRVDLKLDASGVPYLLEINPLPGLHPEHSDLPIIARYAGISFVRLLGLIVSSALSRCETSYSAQATWLSKADLFRVSPRDGDVA